MSVIEVAFSDFKLALVKWGRWMGWLESLSTRTCVRLVVETKRGERSVVPVVGGKAVQTGIRFKSWGVFQEGSFSFGFVIRRADMILQTGGTRQGTFCSRKCGFNGTVLFMEGVPVAFAFGL